MNETSTYKYLPPRLVRRLHGLSIPIKRPMDGSRQSQHRSLAFGASVEFAEYRDYMPGDPIQRIDWSVYARSNRFVIREAHEEVNARTFVLLDISESMQYQEEGSLSKMEYACYLTAGIMYMMIQQGDSVALITFDNKVRDYFPLTSTPSGLKPPLEHLETIQPSTPGNIEEALHEVAELVTGRTLMIVISDLLQEPESVMRGLHHLHHDGKDATVFHVLDPAELSLPISGFADLTEMESGHKLTVDLDEVRDSYVGEVNRYLDELRRGCMGLRFAYILTDTRTEPYVNLRQRSSAG